MIEALLGIVTGQGGLAAAFGGFLMALAAFAALLFKARRDGAGDQRRRDMEADTKAAREAREIEDAIAGRDIDDVKKRLSQWGRK